MIITKDSIVIYAIGLKSEGAITVLYSFLNSFYDEKNILVLIDDKVKELSTFKFGKGVKIEYVKGSFINRIFFDFSIRKIRLKKAIYLGSIPPIFRLNAKTTFLLFQNINILPYFFSFKFFFRYDFLRFLVFKFGRKNIDIFLTLNSVTSLYINKFIDKSQTIKMLNLNMEITNDKINQKIKKKYDFIYPANGLSHKNHLFLFQALIILSKLEIRPSIVLTLSVNDYKKLKINHLKKKYNLNIYNYHSLNRIKFIRIFSSARALVYPSLNESFGLPLMEAKNLKLDIITSNLSFAQNFADPNYTFSINDNFSLVFCIYRYLHNNNLIAKDNFSLLNINDIL